MMLLGLHGEEIHVCVQSGLYIDFLYFSFLHDQNFNNTAPLRMQFVTGTWCQSNEWKGVSLYRND